MERENILANSRQLKPGAARSHSLALPNLSTMRRGPLANRAQSTAGNKNKSTSSDREPNRGYFVYAIDPS